MWNASTHPVHTKDRGEEMKAQEESDEVDENNE